MDKTVKEVATALGLEESRVRRLILSGTLKASKFGSAWAVTDEDLAAEIKRREGLRSAKDAEKDKDRGGLKLPRRQRGAKTE